MFTPCTVVIGAVELLETIRQNVPDNSDILTFSDTEPLRALEAITARRPDVIALERLFAATSRGAALINRIKADPTLREAEIRVMAHDGDYTRVVPRVAPLAAPPGRICCRFKPSAGARTGGPPRFGNKISTDRTWPRGERQSKREG